MRLRAPSRCARGHLFREDGLGLIRPNYISYFKRSKIIFKKDLSSLGSGSLLIPQSCSLSFRAMIAHQSLSNSLPTPASNLASLASSRPPHLVVTLTPFQKATYPAMFFAASLGAA